MALFFLILPCNDHVNAQTIDKVLALDRDMALLIIRKGTSTINYAADNCCNILAFYWFFWWPWLRCRCVLLLTEVTVLILGPPGPKWPWARH